MGCLGGEGFCEGCLYDLGASGVCMVIGGPTSLEALGEILSVRPFKLESDY